jgi:hypothetical protein
MEKQKPHESHKNAHVGKPALEVSLEDPSKKKHIPKKGIKQSQDIFTEYGAENALEKGGHPLGNGYLAGADANAAAGPYIQFI